MAQVANTFDRYASVGVKEDVSDEITMISPTQTPLYTAIGKKATGQPTFQWQEDALATAVANNANIDGDETSFTAVTPTLMRQNYTQILKKSFLISRRAEISDKYGRNSEIDYQTSKRLKEIKRDFESTLCGTQVGVVGTSSTASVTAGLDTWLVSNVSNGASGTNYTGITATSGLLATGARTAGTARAVTEAFFSSVIASCWVNGGEPTMALMSQTQKDKTVAFTGLAANRVNTNVSNNVVLQANWDVYRSPYGDIRMVPTRFMPTTLIYIIDPSLLKVRTLGKGTAFREQLAKTGDADKFHILMDAGLEVSNQSGLGVVRDLN